MTDHIDDGRSQVEKHQEMAQLFDPKPDAPNAPTWYLKDHQWVVYGGIVLVLLAAVLYGSGALRA